MEKAVFALGISGLFATLTAGVFSVPTLFAQADVLDSLALAERLGLGAVMALVGYKVIVKIIDVFGKLLMERINRHDEDSKSQLSSINRKLDSHISNITKKE